MIHRSADKHRQLAAVNANKAATALQLKTSLSSQLSICRKERDNAFKERDKAVSSATDLKACLAEVTREVEMLRKSSEESQAVVGALVRETELRQVAETEKGAIAEREQRLISMLAEFGQVASRYLSTSAEQSSQLAPSVAAPGPGDKQTLEEI